MLSPPFMKGGDYVAVSASGLPDIEGSFVEFNASMGDIIIQKTGAFADKGRVSKTDEHYVAPSSATADFAFKTAFNASNSNSIYGAAETVQPPTLNLICQYRF